MKGVTISLISVLVIIALTFGFLIGGAIYQDTDDNTEKSKALIQENLQLNADIQQLKTQIAALQTQQNNQGKQGMPTTGESSSSGWGSGTTNDPVCGDNIKTTSEQCDDGNILNNDGCSSTCTKEASVNDGPKCGDGVKEGLEQCDDGNVVDTDLCTNGCLLPNCNDGTINGIEICEIGNSQSCTLSTGSTGTQFCNPQCSGYNECVIAPVCRNGIKETPPEECDDGNVINNDLCTNDCKLTKCNDGALNGNEICEIGFSQTCTISGTASVGVQYCNPQCSGYNECIITPICRNGEVEGNEECDDGNLDNTDFCTNNCKLPECGDGFINGNERCELLNSQDCTAPNGISTGVETCNNQCTNYGACIIIPVCRNGVIEGNEECDDGDTDNSDFCTNNCKLPKCNDGIQNGDESCQPGDFVTCSYNSERPGKQFCNSQCNDYDTCIPDPICGNGDKESGEQCDDGNLIDEDGCSSLCRFEGYEGVGVGEGEGDRELMYEPLPEPQGSTRYVESGGSLGSLSPGDTVIFKPGYYSGFSISSSGTASNPIHIMSEKHLEAKISGSVSISGRYIIFEGFDISSSGTAISASGSDNIIIGNKLKNNNAPSHGISLSGDRIQIIQNEIGPVGSSNSGVGNGIAVSSSSSDCLVEDNYIHDVGRSGLFLYPGVQDLTVRLNKIHRSTYHYGHGLYVQGSTSHKIILEYNDFICDGFNACLSFRTSGKVRGNTFIRLKTHDSARGLTSWTASGDFTNAQLLIENNVVYENHGPALKLSGGLQGWDMIVRNNIFIGKDNGAEISGNGDTLILDNNIFGVMTSGSGSAFTGGSSWSKSGSNNLYYNDGEGSIGSTESNSLTGNPGFPDIIDSFNDFILPDSSAQILIDAGINSGATFDWFGLPRPSDGDNDGTLEWDIGAFEY